MAEFCCKNVWLRGKPVLYVSHDHDGSWQLLCGGYEHTDDNEIMVMHKGHLLERDPSLAAALDLPIGWRSERGSLADAWTRESIEVEDEQTGS